MAIPSRAHFFWIGPQLPWAYVFAILSAAERSELSEIVLHHTDAIADGPELRALALASRVRLSRIDPIAYATEAGKAVGVGSELASIYRTLDRPSVKSDILRAAILYLHGGIYLDIDTITTNSLLPLLSHRHFIGSEFIVWPGFMHGSRSPSLWLRSLTLDLLRKAMRRMAHGWKIFRKIEHFYYRAVNGAVMGAEAESPLLVAYLRAMVKVPADRQAAPYALGPGLLQEVVADYRTGDLPILAPEVFYPLAPEISEHWFRKRRRVRLNEVLSTNTLVVHWYASVRTRSRVAVIDPAYVRENRHRQFYSALVCECIHLLPDPT